MHADVLQSMLVTRVTPSILFSYSKAGIAVAAQQAINISLTPATGAVRTSVWDWQGVLRCARSASGGIINCNGLCRAAGGLPTPVLSSVMGVSPA